MAIKLQGGGGISNKSRALDQVKWGQWKAQASLQALQQKQDSLQLSKVRIVNPGTPYFA